MSGVHFDHDADYIRLELSSTNVDDTAAGLAIVARGHSENGSLEIDDYTVRCFECEIVNVD
jgi:hypothetical protein